MFQKSTKNNQQMEDPEVVVIPDTPPTTPTRKSPRKVSLYFNMKCKQMHPLISIPYLFMTYDIN